MYRYIHVIRYCMLLFLILHVIFIVRLLSDWYMPNIPFQYYLLNQLVTLRFRDDYNHCICSIVQLKTVSLHLKVFLFCFVGFFFFLSFDCCFIFKPVFITLENSWVFVSRGWCFIDAYPTPECSQIWSA